MKLFTILYVFLATLAFAAEDLYKSLEITSDASESQIKKAFRKLSVQYHPDKNPHDHTATKKFQEINRAYEILMDPDKRLLYDLYGEEGLSNPQYMQKPKGPNAQAEISVTLEELYNGTEREFSMQKKVICRKCKGTGSKDGTLKVCKHCSGRGVRMQNVNMGIGFNVQMQVPCDRCGGRGKISSGNCPDCRGQQVLSQSKTLLIEIEKGMQDGQNIVFRGESEQSPDYFPGDVVFTLRQRKHPMFRREGNDLHMEMEITLREAILGFKKRIKHLDNHYVEIESNKVIQPFEVKRIEEEGMPVHQLASVKGDLYIKFIVKMPQKLIKKQVNQKEDSIGDNLVGERDKEYGKEGQLMALKQILQQEKFKREADRPNENTTRWKAVPNGNLRNLTLKKDQLLKKGTREQASRRPTSSKLQPLQKTIDKEIESFLSQLGLTQYRDKFLNYNMTFLKNNVSVQQLREMGVLPGHQIKIMRALKEMVNENSEMVIQDSFQSSCLSSKGMQSETVIESKAACWLCYKLYVDRGVSEKGRNFCSEECLEQFHKIYMINCQKCGQIFYKNDGCIVYDAYYCSQQCSQGAHESIRGISTNTIESESFQEDPQEVFNENDDQNLAQQFNEFLTSSLLQ